jgi:hypothetical protein
MFETVHAFGLTVSSSLLFQADAGLRSACEDGVSAPERACRSALPRPSRRSSHGSLLINI